MIAARLVGTVPRWGSSGIRDGLWILVLAVGAVGTIAWLAAPTLRPVLGAPFLLLPPVAILVGMALFRLPGSAWSLMGLGLGAIAIASLAFTYAGVVMPGLDGPTLAARLRARRPDLQIRFCSGYLAGATEVELAIASGALLAKPFTVEALGAAVRDALGAPRSH